MKWFKIISVVISLVSLYSWHPSKDEMIQPNILFCLADDVSYPHMGAYGCDWVQTPNFDRVAKEGLLFTNAYTPNAKCAPSRACILTGRNSWQLKEAANHFCYFPKEFKTYPEALAENGYFVGATGKKWAPGDPGIINGKKRHLAGQGWDAHKLKAPTPDISANDYAANFKQFLKDKPKDQPFCFWFGSLEPHRAYTFRSSVDIGGYHPNQIDKVPDFWPDNDSVRVDMMDYAYELNHFDQHLGKMIAYLEETGELENTIVVVTADNGMPFPRAKGQAYQFSNHLPLAIMWPQGIQKPGRVIDDFVSFIDLAPSFLDLAGVDMERSGMEPVTGESLRSIFTSKDGGWLEHDRKHVLIGKERHDIGRPNDQGYPIRGMVTEEYLFVKNYKTERWPAGNPEMGYPNVDASPTKTQVLRTLLAEDEKKYWDMSFGKRTPMELYNLKEDPYCINNLAESEPELLDSFCIEMERELTLQGDPRMFGEGDLFDNYKYSGRDSGYYNRRTSGELLEAGWLNPDDRNYVPLKHK